MSADNGLDAPTTEQKGKGKAPIDEPVQEDRFSLRDSTYGTGGAYPTPTTPLFPPPQEQNRQHQGGLTVVEEDEKLEHFPLQNANSRYPPTIIGSASDDEAASPHERLEVRPADDVDDKSIATNDWAAPGYTTWFRPIDWTKENSSRPDAQRVAADRKVSPTSRGVEAPSTDRRSMKLSGRGSTERRAKHEALDEDLDRLPSSDALGAAFADNNDARDHHPRVNSSNARSAAANQQSVAMSDPQSLLSALNATPMRSTRSRSNAAFRRLSVTHSEIVRARSEERRKGLKENEIPPKARAKLGIQAPVRQVPNPADPTSHLPPAFARRNPLSSREGNAMPRSEIPRRFKPPAPAEVAARRRRQVSPNRRILSATTGQDGASRECSRPRNRVERWVYGENHPLEFYEGDENQRLLQDMNGRTRNELQPLSSAEGFLHPSSDPPTSEDSKKKAKEGKRAFWANCRRRAAKILKKSKNKKPAD